jgi:hypothetical protein
MKGSGFPKGETLVSPFGGASFGTFLPLVGEKYIKTNKQINPNLYANKRFVLCLLYTPPYPLSRDLGKKV